jgi:ABC-type dipeptide/oligopeptide/nickel transport system permease subunit
MTTREVSQIKRPAGVGTTSAWREAGRIVFRKRGSKLGLGILAVIFAAVIFGPLVLQFNPNVITPKLANLPPSLAHPFGTDWHGRDILLQVIYGGRPSLLVSIACAMGAVALGFVVGLLAGYFGKLTGPLSGAADCILTLPLIPLVLMVASLFTQTDALIIALLTAFLWPSLSRAVRTQVMALKKLPYMEAAKTSGLSDVRVLFGVVVPKVGSIAIAYFILDLAASLVIVTALQFLGLGNPAVVSWGSILYWAQQDGFITGDWWWIVAPGIIITLVASGFALLGFSLEEVLNPRLR